MVVQDQTEMFLNLNHHPVCAASDASRFFITGAVHPSLARRGDGLARQYVIAAEGPGGPKPVNLQITPTCYFLVGALLAFVAAGSMLVARC